MSRSTPWLSSIRNKLMLLFFAVTAGAILIVYFYVIPQLESNLTQQKVDALKQEATDNIGFFERAYQRDNVSITYIDSLTSRVSDLAGSRVSLYGIRTTSSPQTGQKQLSEYLISDSRDVGTRVRPSPSVVLSAARTREEANSSTSGGRSLAQVAEPIAFRNEVPWVVVFSDTLDDVQDNVALIRRQVLIAGTIALLVSMLAGYFFSSVLARRVRRLETAAADVAAGNFSTPIPIESEDELGQLARAFNDMQRQLARVDDARKEFIANASHELRTPIFSLGGFVELLQDEDLDDATREEFLATMSEQIERLQKLTTELLDLSRLDAGSLTLDLEPVPLRLLARDVTSEFTVAAAQHQSRIEIEQESEQDVEAICDPSRVEQILRVLLSNAIGHTHPGTDITLTVDDGERAGKPMAMLSVRDNGEGISKKDLPNIFERFHSGDSVQGSGLGLAIARELAQHMKGRLEVSSEPGNTVFTLTLPLAGKWTPPAARPPSGQVKHSGEVTAGGKT